MKDKYYKLAQLIKLAGTYISKESVDKTYNVHYILGCTKNPGLEVTDDSGYRAIVVGDVYTDNGYAYIYTENADENEKFKYNCFPSVKLIAERLRAMANKETFYIKGDKAYTEDVGAYDSYGVMRSDRKNTKASQKTISYLSKVVEGYADKIEADPRSAEEIFEAA